MNLGDFWLAVLIGSVGLFAIMVIVCGIGGFADLLSLFRELQGDGGTVGDDED